MLNEAKEAWRRVGQEFVNALLTSAALVLGRRQHGSRIVKFGSYLGFPRGRNSEPE